MGAVLDLVQDMEQALGRSETDLTPWFHTDFVWDGNAGCGRKTGLEQFRDGWQAPFRSAFGARRYETSLWLEDADWAACIGTCHATHSGSFMGIPATGRPVRIPYVDFWKIRDGRIAYNKVDVDLASVAAQLGWDVFEARGWDRLDPPVTRLWRGQSGQGAAVKPLDVVQAMEGALQRSDVDVSDYFHEDFVWDANYGCGLKHGLQEFEQGWYLPFREFFGNRDFLTEHYMQDGDWAACFGACHATLDADFMGIAATGQPIRIPYIDFWRIEGSKIAENIVRVDFASVVKQLGGDVFLGRGWETAQPTDHGAHPAS
ncbi:MAG: ester cyclase [Ruegeria sp.]|uniref:ester cyclase n=1 Tax=Ruegeria sp. TaxID=1879320 RepID=UPI00349EACC6